MKLISEMSYFQIIFTDWEAVENGTKKINYKINCKWLIMKWARLGEKFIPHKPTQGGFVANSGTTEHLIPEKDHK